MDKTKIIEFYIEQGILLSPELLSILDSPDSSFPVISEFIVLNKDTLNIINSKKNIIVEDFEKAVVLKEKHKNTKHYDRFIEILSDDNFTKNISNLSKINNNVQNANTINRDNSNNKTDNTSTKTNKVFNTTNNISDNNLTKNITLATSNIPSLQNNSASINNNELKKELIIESKSTEIKPTEINTSKKIEETFEKTNYNLDNPESLDFEVSKTDNSSNESSNENALKISDAKDALIEKQKKEEFMKLNRVKIVSSYTSKSKKWTVNDFVSLYVNRFKELEKILRSRQELQSLTSISKITAKKDRENVSFIGVVYEKSITKNGNIMFNIEDQTGSVKVVVSKTKDSLFKLAEEIQLDETIGVVGTYDQIVFASNLLFPDIPLTKELKKSPEEGYIVIISDTQVGGKLFLDKEFHKFLSWINGELGNDIQKEIASKVRYVFIGGDLVEGVGIYPNQEYDLNIIDVKDQYREFADLMKKIPKHLPIIVCPGNHDVGRLSEPQLPLSAEYASPLLDLPNIISVSNPSIINIYAQPENNFDGLDIMFYHGYSFIYYSEKIPVIRQSGGQKRPDLIMKYLLQRRHLAPSHTSTLYIPDPRKDPLVIDKIPDILISGHIHRSSVSSYKNITCFNASCWVAKSEEQERRGLEPQPGRAFIVDMKTREVKVMNFLSKEDQEKELGTPTNAPQGVSA